MQKFLHDVQIFAMHQDMHCCLALDGVEEHFVAPRRMHVEYNALPAVVLWFAVKAMHNEAFVQKAHSLKKLQLLLVTFYVVALLHNSSIVVRRTELFCAIIPFARQLHAKFCAPEQVHITNAHGCHACAQQLTVRLRRHPHPPCKLALAQGLRQIQQLLLIVAVCQLRFLSSITRVPCKLQQCCVLRQPVVAFHRHASYVHWHLCAHESCNSDVQVV